MAGAVSKIRAHSFFSFSSLCVPVWENGSRSVCRHREFDKFREVPKSHHGGHVIAQAHGVWGAFRSAAMIVCR